MDLLIGVLTIYGIYRIGKMFLQQDDTDRMLEIGDFMCKCYREPKGSLPVLQAGPDLIVAEASNNIAHFHIEGKAIKVKWRGLVFTMLWRLVGQDGLTSPHKMQRRPDGTWFLLWSFAQPTCWCLPEATHFEKDGLCQAIYNPTKRVLEFKLLNKAQSSPQGLN